MITTGANAALELEFEFDNGSVMALGSSAEALLDINRYQPEATTPQSDITDSDVATLQQALLDGADPTQLAEATAAGANAGTNSGNEGASIVQINHNSVDASPESGFETAEQIVPFLTGAIDEGLIAITVPVSGADATPAPGIAGALTLILSVSAPIAQAESYTYQIDVRAALTDSDGSDILSGVTITSLPAGTTIADTPSSANTYDVGWLTLVSDRALSSAEINGIQGAVTATDGSDSATTLANVKVASTYADFSDLSLESWGNHQRQDRAPSSETTDTNNVLTLAGNSWKAVTLDQLGVTDDFDWSNGSLTFETNTTEGGELQGIMFDSNLRNNNGRDQPNLVKVDGSQRWGNNADFSSEDLGDGWSRIEVDLSTLNQSNGQFEYLVFVNDDDASPRVNNPLGEISFRNLSISDAPIDGGIGTDTLLEGTSGNDALYSNNGDDILIGGAGNDLLSGGIGEDIFVWNQQDIGTSAMPAVDIVVDFDHDNDVLDLTDLLSDPETNYSIEGIDNNGSLQLNIGVADVNGDIAAPVQEIELNGLAAGIDPSMTLQNLLDTGAVNEGG